MYMDYHASIRAFIEKGLVVFEDEAVFSDSDNIFELGFVNSLFAMQLLEHIESKFNIQIENEDLDIKNFSTINNIVDLIKKKVG